MSTDWKRIATALIKQLPSTHEGRNTWLMNNSDCSEGKNLKVKNILCNTASSLEEKVSLIDKVFYQGDVTEGECVRPISPQGHYQSPQNAPRW